MRAAIVTLHLYVALLASVVILILGVTGSIMAFEPEIDHLLHARLTYVVPGSSTVSLAAMGRAVSDVFPGERIGGYVLAASPDRAAQVSLRRGLVSVNPHTGEVLGVRPVGQDFLSTVHSLHLRLLVGSGKRIVAWAGVAMLILLLSGLYLWWPLKRIRIDRRTSSARFWFDLHNVVGVFSFVFLLLLTITGVLIGFDDRTVPWFYTVTGSAPFSAVNLRITPAAGATPITPDQAVEIARGALPGAVPFQVNVPGPNDAYVVRARYPEDLTPGGRSLVVVDPYTGRVLAAQGSRSAPAGRRLEIANRAIHTGDIFGIPSKIIMSVTSLMAPVQLVSGLTWWWRRRVRPTGRRISSPANPVQS